MTTTVASTSPLRVAVILGSTRAGRRGATVADWFMEVAASRDDIEPELLDLADVELPAALPHELDDSTRTFVQRLESADAFVVVTPEYNHSYPASLKQAMDISGGAWTRKPVGFVSYGGLSGGLRAVEHLRPVFSELRATTVRETVSLHRLPFDEHGWPTDTVGSARAAHVMLDDLVWWAMALRAARTRDRGWHESGEPA